ncbi:MAG: hypothetical protein AB1758_31120, partial [Candidatus Eremiobacterota bacterium]
SEGSVDVSTPSVEVTLPSVPTLQAPAPAETAPAPAAPGQGRPEGSHADGPSRKPGEGKTAGPAPPFARMVAGKFDPRAAADRRQASPQSGGPGLGGGGASEVRLTEEARLRSLTDEVVAMRDGKEVGSAPPALAGFKAAPATPRGAHPAGEQRLREAQRALSTACSDVAQRGVEIDGTVEGGAMSALSDGEHRPTTRIRVARDGGSVAGGGEPPAPAAGSGAPACMEAPAGEALPPGPVLVDQVA